MVVSRAIRLFELRERLQAAAETTVDALAVALGVSERTVRRDLATLREQGLSITGEPGPGGGIRLEGRRGLTAVHLAVEDVVSLWLAVRIAQAIGPLAGPLPWGRRAERVVPKLLSSLPPARARALRDLCRRIHVGPPASDAVRTLAGTGVPELMSLVERAAYEGLALRFGYRDRNGRASTRFVEPHGVLIQLPVWYLLAYDVTAQAPRAFRMDRINTPSLDGTHRFDADVRIVRALLPGEVVCRALS
ncbi:WYL domain-containing protein [Gemmatimonas sp.]|uniref:helix-turn-helix transcriptional regulator n=1 Tax=Gemmatimonas sp. TaxID=1962908 RepID=UPI0033403682